MQDLVSMRQQRRRLVMSSRGVALASGHLGYSRLLLARVREVAGTLDRKSAAG